MKYISIIFSTLGVISGIFLAINSYSNNCSSEAAAWAISAIWAANCMLDNLRDFSNRS